MNTTQYICLVFGVMFRIFSPYFIDQENNNEDRLLKSGKTQK